MQYLNYFRKVYNECSRMQKMNAIFLVIVYLFFFYTYMYSDPMSTIGHGLSIWDSLFSGNIGDYYRQSIYMNFYPYLPEELPFYEFPIYFVFAIWNFPIWAISKIVGFDPLTSLWCMMWGKTMILVFAIVFLYTFSLLLRELACSEDTIVIASIILVTSCFFVTSTFIIGQYDLIGMSFINMGILYYLRRNKTRFMLWFALAIPFKLFPLIVFLPLLLMKEKRIQYIIADIFIVCLPELVLRLWLVVSENTGSGNMATVLPLEYKISLVSGIVYILPLAYIVLLIVCYVYINPRNINGDVVMYIALCSLVIMMVFMNAFPYRFLMMTPFMTYFIVNKEKYAGILLETIGSWGLIFSHIFVYDWCYSSAIAEGMWLRIFRTSIDSKDAREKFYAMAQSGEEVADTTSGMDSLGSIIDVFSGLGATLFLACMVIFMIIYFPNSKIKTSVSECQSSERNYKIIFALRLLSGIAILLIPLLKFIIKRMIY